MREIGKKGQIGNIPNVVLSLVFIAIILGAGFLILEEFRDQTSDISDDKENSTAYQGINDTIEAMTTIPDLLPLIVLVVVIGIIIAVVFNALPLQGGRVSGA